MPYPRPSSAVSSTNWPPRPRSRGARTGCRWRPHWNGSHTEYWCNGTGRTAPRNSSPPAEDKLERVPIRDCPAYDSAMSRIGPFADDDAAAWVMKSPDIGVPMAGVTNPGYNENPVSLGGRVLA